jgi:Heavy metal binding domain
MKLIKILLIACALIITSNAVIFAQMQMSGDHSKMEMKKDTLKSDANNIIRTGVISLKAIDKNKDGKVFQDQMDFNVISDKPGVCPLCGMTLKEVTLKEAKATLLKHGFKVK